MLGIDVYYPWQICSISLEHTFSTPEHNMLNIDGLFRQSHRFASNICFLTLARLNMGTHQIIWRLVSSGDIAMAPMKLSKSQKVRWTTWMDFST